MAQRPSDESEHARRQKFLKNFQSFDANIRFPAPYVEFAGKPLATMAETGWRYDALGYRNDVHVQPRSAAETLRIFVVGDSTLVEGQTFADTVPGRMETGLKRVEGPGARVYNFGVTSACLNQMTALITTRLMDLEPDVVLILGGATDIFQPWSFDPRAGYPYNHFAAECLYDFVFDPRKTGGDAPELSYDRLQEMIFGRLENLRALTHWQSDIWEWEVVRQFELALKRVARLAPGIGAPIRFILQPSVVTRPVPPPGSSSPISTGNTRASRASSNGSRPRPTRPSRSGISAGCSRTIPGRCSPTSSTSPARAGSAWPTGFSRTWPTSSAGRSGRPPDRWTGRSSSSGIRSPSCGASTEPRPSRPTT
jgi:hypothetical protein